MFNAYHSRGRYRLRYLSKTGSHCPGSWSSDPDQVVLLDLVISRSRFSDTTVLEATEGIPRSWELASGKSCKWQMIGNGKYN